jgi:hypothetical protein
MLHVNIIIAFRGLGYLALQKCCVDYTALNEIAVIRLFGQMFKHLQLF